MHEPKKDFLIGIFIFIFYIAISYYSWMNNILLTVTLGLVSLLILLKWTNLEEKFIYFTGFFLGPVIDIIIVPTGIWTYENPTLFMVPMWLPFTYGIAGVLLIKLGKSISKIYSEQKNKFQ